MIGYTILIVIASMMLNTFITNRLILQHHKMILDHYEKYQKKTVLNQVAIESILKRKDKDKLLELFEETNQEIEETN